MSEHASMQGDHDPIAMHARNKAVREAEDKQIRLNKYAPEMLFFLRGDAEGHCYAPTFAKDQFATDCGGCRPCQARALLAKIEGNGK